MFEQQKLVCILEHVLNMGWIWTKMCIHIWDYKDVRQFFPTPGVSCINMNTIKEICSIYMIIFSKVNINFASFNKFCNLLIPLRPY
jgi:hypothetical protein